MVQASVLTAKMEDYLATIFAIAAEGQTVIGARLAEHLRVTPSSVTDMIQRLVAADLVRLNDRKEIFLTEAGRQIAEAAVRRHRLAERILTDLLHFDWAEAHQEANAFEHGLTPQIADGFFELLGRPQTCPHGSPIPGSGADLSWIGLPMDRARVGDEIIVERITEAGEMDHVLLQKLGTLGMRPGTRLTVVAVEPWNDSLTLQRSGETLSLRLSDAALIWVRPAE